MGKVRDHFLTHEEEAVESVMAVSGISFGGNGQNMGLAFVRLKDWDLRQRPDLKVEAITGRAMTAFSQIREAMVFAFPPPAVIELGNASGFDFQLQDRGGVGHAKLMAAPQPAFGDGGPGSAPCQGSAQRHGRRARIPDRRRLGKGRRPGRSHCQHSQHDCGGLWQFLCQRFYPGRPGQAGIRTGRCPGPYAARGPEKALCAQQ